MAEELTKNDNATENDKISFKINCKIKNANAFLLNGKFYQLDNENQTICEYEKNCKMKIEFVHYDEKKKRFYYLPETSVYEFNTSTFNNNNNSIELNIDENGNCDAKITFTKTSINHEKSANSELGFGIPSAIAAIGFALALFFGGLHAIIALPFIIGFGCLAVVLITIGSYYKHYILESKTENSYEQNSTLNRGTYQSIDQDIDNPIWTQTSTEPNPLFNGSNDDDEIMHTGFEESWGENVI